MNRSNDPLREAPAPDPGEGTSPPVGDELRELFRRAAPVPRPVDVDQLLAAAARPRELPVRRLPWMQLAAAFLLLVAGSGIGWSAARLEGRKEVARLEKAVEADLDRLRREWFGGVARALDRSREEILEIQQDSIKQVALLLRDDFRTRLARVQADLRGLLLSSAKMPATVYANFPGDLRQELEDR